MFFVTRILCVPRSVCVTAPAPIQLGGHGHEEQNEFLHVARWRELVGVR
jgi:hypothetical protein